MTPAPRTLPRRTVLAASGTAVLAAAAACSSAATPSTTSAGSPTAASAAASSTAKSTTTATSAPAAASSAAAAPPAEATSAAAEPAPSGTVIAAAADVESAGSVVVDGPSGPVLLAWDNGTVVGHSAVCTHQGCTVAASGACPCHGSSFNVATGAVENRPGAAAAADRFPWQFPAVRCTRPDRHWPIARPADRTRTGSAQPGPSRNTQEAPRISGYEHQ